MKKVLSLVLALVLVLGSFSAVLAAPSDVVGTEYEAAVDRLIQLGALDGYPDGSFKPANTITRAEFAAAVVKVKGLKAAAEAAKGLATEFKDVPATHWASGYIGVANRLGLVNGMGDGTYAPESPITYEQAVTLVIRAIGYEPAAQARGAYPYGYLIVANENGLLDAVKGNQGLPASRGLVAQLLDNALEIPMMVQVGFGTQATWAVSGTQGTKVRLLLDDLGFDNVEGRVVGFDSARNRVTLNVDGKDKVLSVNEGFDFNHLEGLNIKAWFTGSKIVVYSALDQAKVDATTGAAKIKLVGENKTYVVAKDAYLELNGDDVEAADFTADYAKVVLNAEGEIVWAKGYTFGGFVVVKEVKNDIAYGYDKDELDIEDYTVLKDGRTISADDVEEGDILFFNKAEEFAVVYNNSKNGDLERVYSSEFKFAGKVYSIIEGAKYLEKGYLGTLDADALDAMMDEDKTVEVFFNLKGQVVLVEGNLGTATSSSFYGKVTAKTTSWDGRGGKLWSLDVRNEEGKVVSYDLKDNFVKNLKSDGTALTGDSRTFVNHVDATAWADTIIKVDAPVRVTLNSDGVPTKVELLAVRALAEGGFKVSATYAKAGSVDYRLQSSTLVFYGNKVVKLADATDFTVVKAGDIYAANGRVVVVYATGTDANDDTTAYTGLVKRVRNLTSGAREITLEVFGETKVFTTGTTIGSAIEAVAVNDFAKVTVGNKNEVISAVAKVTINTTEEVVSRNTANRTIVVEGPHTYELNPNAVVYSLKGTTMSTISLRDLVAEDNITVYTDKDSDRFVNYVVRKVDATPETPETPDTLGTLKAAYVLDGKTYIQVVEGTESAPKTVTYEYIGVEAPAALKDLVGKVVEITKVVVNEKTYVQIVELAE